MDKRFPVWLHMRLSSQNSIEKVRSTIQRMFAVGDVLPLKRSTFQTDKILVDYLTKRAKLNTKLRIFVTNTNTNDDSDEDGVKDDIESNKYLDVVTTDLGYAAVTHEITAVGYYAEFLGCIFIYSDKFINRMGMITKYLQQSDVSMNIQDNSNILLLFDQIHTKLRERQTSINDRIARWLTLGNLAESTMSLKLFGFHELQPFIELCLRYLFLPMNTSRLQNMRMVLIPLPPDLDELYDSDARDAVFAPHDAATSVDDMIFLDGDHLTHVSMVYSNTDTKSNTHGKLVARPINQSLSVYIYFFFKYCKGNWNTQRKRVHTVGETHPLFGGILGGTWKSLQKHVRAYGIQIGLPVDKMGLKKSTSSYMHQSRVAWVASRASTLNINQIAADTKAVKMGFARDHKFYPGLESLRDTQRARERLGETSTKVSSAPIPSLLPVVNQLYPLLMEMQGIEGNDPCFPSIASLVSGVWIDVDRNDKLYSKEFNTGIGDASTSIKQYLITERKNINRKIINMSERKLRNKKRYPAMFKHTKAPKKMPLRAVRASDLNLPKRSDR